MIIYFILFGKGGSGPGFLQDETAPTVFKSSQYSLMAFLMLVSTSGLDFKYFLSGSKLSTDCNLMDRGCGEVITLFIHESGFPSCGGAIPVEYFF